MAYIKDLLVQTNSENSQIESNWIYKHIQLYKSVTSLTYVISPIVIKVSVLSNLRISGCELRDSYYVSFAYLFKKKSYHYISISVILSPIAGFLSLVWVLQFSQFEKGILCP